MRYLELPIDCKPISVYISCIRSIRDVSKRDKYYRLICNYTRVVALYKQNGQDGKLYKFSRHSGMLPRSYQYTVSGLSTKHLKELWAPLITPNFRVN